MKRARAWNAAAVVRPGQEHLIGQWYELDESAGGCAICNLAYKLLGSDSPAGILFLELEGDERHVQRVHKMTDGWPTVLTCERVTIEQAKAELAAFAADGRSEASS